MTSESELTAALAARGVHVGTNFFRRLRASEEEAEDEEKGEDQQEEQKEQQPVACYSVDQLFQFALDSDLRLVGEAALPKEINTAKQVDGKLCVQLLSVRNIAQPSSRESVPGLQPQVLQLRLTDGIQKVTAFELNPVPRLSVSLPPGTKLLLESVAVRNGKLLLTETNTRVLGGKVRELYTSWKANKELKEKKRIMGADVADPPPHFTPFDLSSARAEKKEKKTEHKRKPKPTQESMPQKDSTALSAPLPASSTPPQPHSKPKKAGMKAKAAKRGTSGSNRSPPSPTVRQPKENKKTKSEKCLPAAPTTATDHSTDSATNKESRSAGGRRGGRTPGRRQGRGSNTTDDSSAGAPADRRENSANSAPAGRGGHSGRRGGGQRGRGGRYARGR